MENEFAALTRVEYSGDNILLGWNLKFRKAGRALCDDAMTLMRIRRESGRA